MARIVHRMAWILFVLGALAVGALVLAAWQSRSMQPEYGLDEGRLRACPGTPNCVCSEAECAAPGQAIEPLPLDGRPPGAAWEALQSAIEAEGGATVLVGGDYLAATFRTPLLGFVDDLEARLDREREVIQLRSASRVGRSDLGANWSRVERLRARFEAVTGGRGR